MRVIGAALLASCIWLAPAVARADLTNNSAIDDHADAMVARLDLGALDATQKQALFADRLTLSLGGLIPVFGSYRLDTRVYGEVRPAAILFDWVLGGFAPAGLAVTALAGHDALSSHVRSTLAWTALGIYAGTRAGVIFVGNLHISEYNRRVRWRLGLSAASDGGLGPTLVASASW